MFEAHSMAVKGFKSKRSQTLIPFFVTPCMYYFKILSSVVLTCAEDAPSIAVMDQRNV